MAFTDLREFIHALEERGWLKRIQEEVDCDLEITEITDRVSKMSGEKNVAILFENVKGYNMPVLMNAFGSMERMALALGVDKLDDIAAEVKEIFKLPYISVQNKLDLLKIIPTAKRAINFPKYVKSGSCKEVIIKDQPSLDKFPILKCWPGDAGKFITLPLVFTKNPLNGKRNVGMYRLQVYDGQTTGMHWHIHKNGAENYRAHQTLGKDRIEVAVAIGTDPALTYAATAPLPKDIDEMVFAGFLRKKSVEMIKCETVDVEVPAHSEIVLEGYVMIDELRREGPFGDHTGYYSLADDYPVFHITCITHRKDPIYPATIVGKPPMEDCFLAKATERIFLPVLQMNLPEIIDLNLPLEGVFHNCAVVSIKKTYPQQAKKVMHAIWGMGQMMFTKMVIVVDEHVNVQDMNEVWWRVYNNIDARRDIVMVDGPLDVLDHSSPMPNWGTKVGIDATKAWAAEGYTREWPDEIEMSAEIKEMVDKKWKGLGLE
ncbi:MULTISPECIES: menaquinone biosynthesis decarboxylase [Pelosinus]|uniref:Menaquinone biosynthesis decarboxylase, SCO4490 family n=1 Tax=Pelosinus fermentans B4 TaxID=1149862 RepID=I9LK03_9FIRM|nr:MULTISPECIES: menaquinone biosynthesis decarboxylase [Pelosinus]EIW20761.1 menaquinone biosynthesis decarboxylase, SCO4490 family [Pelosinus fermentans B4]EIW25394.1 menaquinone biosynthesis decarboxylase, SCO4490 family [Pelosinus fermentans A11]OAM93652.1 menaquinone biosynthesis decarboxylase, SCO4490 family [Pelosinus fermentans DSM 17108]SDQ85382.1 4-hydroxy-3-polyprenylbenzoate decarboxylase [Pelosinus fermentans]